MRNLFPVPSSVSVTDAESSNTFMSGRGMDSLWVSQAQASHFSPVRLANPASMWVNSVSYAHASDATYTHFPTAIFSLWYLLLGQLSPLSTGPIKSPNKVHKEKRI